MQRGPRLAHAALAVDCEALDRRQLIVLVAVALAALAARLRHVPVWTQMTEVECLADQILRLVRGVDLCDQFLGSCLTLLVVVLIGEPLLLELRQVDVPRVGLVERGVHLGDRRLAIAVLV